MTSAKKGKNLAAILEGILFVSGAPMSTARLAKHAEASEDEARRALETLRASCAGRGLVLMEHAGAWQMGTHPDHARYVENMMKDEFSEELSPASRETMAVIAYRGPVTRAEIDYIRGVNSSFTLRTLLMRGLAERDEKSADGRAPRYRAGMDFLRHMGVARLKDLPRYEEFSAPDALPPPVSERI